MFSLPIYFIIFIGFFSYLFGKNRSKKKFYLKKIQEDKQITTDIIVLFG